MNRGKTANLAEEEYDEEVYDYLVERIVEQEDREIIQSFRKFVDHDNYTDF